MLADFCTGGKTLPEIQFILLHGVVNLARNAGRLMHGWQNLTRDSVHTFARWGKPSPEFWQTFARWGMTSPEIRADFTPVCNIEEGTNAIAKLSDNSRPCARVSWDKPWNCWACAKDGGYGHQG